MLTLRFWLQATGEAQTVWVLPPYFPADSLEGREFGWESDPNLKRDAGEVGEIDATRARTIGRTGESLSLGERENADQGGGDWGPHHDSRTRDRLP